MSGECGGGDKQLQVSLYTSLGIVKDINKEMFIGCAITASIDL